MTPLSESASAPSFEADLLRVIASPVYQFLVATAIGSVIFFARAPGPYLAPSLFAEDFWWTSIVHGKGLWNAAHVRGDYLLLGNFVVLWLGMQLAEWGCGDVFAMPRCLALVSYIFFASVASLPVLLLRKQLSSPYRWSAWLLVCLMPLGLHSKELWSGVEILGRAANVGYVFLYVAFILLWYRNTEVRSFMRALPVDLGLLVCTATNPICIAMLVAAAWPTVRRWIQGREPAGKLLREGAFVSMCILAIACLVLNGLPVSRHPGMAGPSPTVSPAQVFEMGLARGLLYPLVWPFYHSLSTGATIVLAMIAVATTWWIGQPRHRPLVIAGWAVIAIVTAVFAVQRGEVAASLDGYRSTFPDRYFMGQNMVATLLVVGFAADVAERLAGRMAWLPLAGLLGLALASAIHEPPWKLSPSQFLRNDAILVESRIIESAAQLAYQKRYFVNGTGLPDPDGAFVQIHVHPTIPGKAILLPRSAVERALTDRQRLAALGGLRR